MSAQNAMLCIGGGKTLFIGGLDYVDWHSHGAPVFIASLGGNFRLRWPGSTWVSCRTAIIPAGFRHALDTGDEPVAVFYPEPHLARFCDLTRLGHGWDAEDKVLIGRHPDLSAFLELYESRDSLTFVGEALDDLLCFMRSREKASPIDPRIARVLERLEAAPDDLTAAANLAKTEGLSASRFQHLFSDQVGVPFRRFRIWNRVRATLSLALDGQSLTQAAHNSGFSDLAHFTRLHRDTFGVTATSTLRRVARIGAHLAPR